VGVEKVKAAEAIRAECFPNWAYTGLSIHRTTDPRYFVADVNGKGTCIGYAEKSFEHKERFY